MIDEGTREMARRARAGVDRYGNIVNRTKEERLRLIGEAIDTLEMRSIAWDLEQVNPRAERALYEAADEIDRLRAMLPT